MRRWQLQHAKARLSELLRSSEEEGPQEITVRGKPAAVVVARPDYDRMRGRRSSFVRFLRDSPLVGVRLQTTRDRSPARDVRL